MEDSMLLHGQYRDSAHEDLFGVFDGHGGDECAKFVQRCFGLVLSQRLAQYPNPSDTEKAIRATYDTIDLECKARFTYQGTTALVCYIAGDTLWVSNAGDSRAVLATKTGALRMSFDHKAEDKSEKERIEKEGGFVDSDDRVSGKLAVTRAFGDRDVGPWVKATPHVMKHMLSPEDEFLVLACDGVYDVMSDKAVVECIEKQIVQQGVTDPQRWARKLVSTAIKRETDDNVSVVVVSLAARRIEAKSSTPKVIKKREKSLSFTAASSSAALVKRRDSAALTAKQ
jgi:serine/threonine protein phosphatase PrpC